MALSPCNTTTNAQGRELVEHGTTALPVACYHDDLNAEAVPWHWHDELEAVAVTEGVAVVAAGTAHYTLRCGEGIFVNAGVLHADWNAGTGACRFHSLVFHPRLVGGSVESVFWQRYLQPLVGDVSLEAVVFGGEIGWHGEAIQAIENAWTACVDEPPGYEFRVREELSRLVWLLVSQRPAARERPSSKAMRDGERIKLMLQFIHERYSEELKTTQIAQSALISASECLRCFRATIGASPIQYLRQYRVQRAAELLTGTGMKIVDIGAKCGFQEMSYFAKTFREVFGCTPSEYRARER